MLVEKNYTIDVEQYPGIVKVVFKDNHDFCLSDAQALLEDLKIICSGNPKPILKILGKYSSIDTETRNFIAGAEAMQYSSAEALVTNYLPHRIIGNFYMRINKPVKPTAFFDIEEKAVEWLKAYTEN